jgi:acetyl-CoA carboxylase biotin carboxyl carrier protein
MSGELEGTDGAAPFDATIADPIGDATPFDAVISEVIPALAARLRASGLAELEVRTGDWRVRVRRDVPTGPRPPRAATGKAGAHDRGAAVVPTGSDQNGVARSPAVGYFVPALTSEVGRIVRSGDVLGHVEMLGIQHDVAAPIDGVVIRAIASSGEAVEYGQPLLLVEAGGSIAVATAAAVDG